MKTVELKFQYTEDEYVKAARQYLFASRTITKTKIVTLILFLMFSVYYFFSSFSVLGGIALGVTLFALILGCTLYFYIPIYRFKQTTKYHEEYQLIFSNDGIKFKTPTINSDLKWDIYSQIWENSIFYFLIQAPNVYTTIPKRAFANPSDKQAFEEMVLSNLKCTKRML